MTTLLNDYELLKSMDLIVRSHKIIIKNNKKDHIFIDKIYNYNGNPIKHESKFNNYHNAIHVFTGDLHGGYIGIDIDIKCDKNGNNDSMMAHVAYCKILLDKSIHTLTCITPSGGFHYVYKLNEKQREVLKYYNTKQPRLFDYNIDVLYNTGRFIMSGSYEHNGNIFEYKIVDSTKPAILPNIIFNEIIKCFSIKKSLGGILSSNNNNSKSLNQLKINNKDNCKENKNINVNENKNEILNLYLECLDPARCDKYDSWLRIGAIIFNEGGTFELFDKWSQLSKKYEYDSCQKVWKSYGKYNKDKLTIGSLKKYAKDDNPIMYRSVQNKTKFKKPTCQDIEKCIDILNEIYKEGTVNDKIIADLIYCLYPKKFIYDTINKYWYTLNKYNIYEQEDKNLFVARELMNTHILEIIIEDSNNRKNECTDQIAILEEKMEKIHNDKLFDKLESLKNKLSFINSTSFNLRQYICSETKKDHIIRALATLCRKKNIYEKLDTINPYLFAFKNGVYDLKQKIFRLPTPDEYISCTTKYKYYPPDPKYVKELEKIISDIFPDIDELVYTMMQISTALIGTNTFEVFLVFMGSGSNGKGILSQLLDIVLGSYYGTLDIDYFNNKDSIKSSSATPALAACKNSRWVNVSEISSNTKFKDNRLKQLSGRDKIQARNLYGNSFEYIAKFKLCFQTNERPIIDGADEAIRRRLRFITFRSKFVDNPILAHEKQIDRQLKDRIIIDDQYKYAFFAILLKYYYMLSEEKNMKFTIPKTFENDLNEYLTENDPVGCFIKDCLKVDDNKQKIKSSDLFNEFKIYSNNASMCVSKFKSILEKNGFKAIREKTGMIYRGLSFKFQPSIQQKINLSDIEFIEDQNS